MTVRCFPSLTARRLLRKQSRRQPEIYGAIPLDRHRVLYALTDPQAALTFAKTDTVDLALLVLRRYFPLQVEEYNNFTSQHREFLLVSANLFDWWPSRLLHDGQELRLIATDGNTRIYKVFLKP